MASTPPPKREHDDTGGSDPSAETRKRTDVDVNLPATTASCKARFEELRQRKVAALTESTAIIQRLKKLGMTDETIAASLPDNKILTLTAVRSESTQSKGKAEEEKPVNPESAELKGKEAEKGETTVGGAASTPEEAKIPTKTQKTFAQAVNGRWAAPTRK